MTLQPDWEQIDQGASETFNQAELNEYWSQQCYQWLSCVAAEYGSNYRIEESSNFYILSDESPRYVEVFSAFLERTLRRILKTLPHIARDEGFGKHVAMIFKDADHYYDYISRFYPPEGEFGLSTGLYINEGYGHFAFPSQDISYAETIAVHELTHACLAHLNIPLWLNEGLAVLMEDVLAGQHLFIDHEIMSQHRQYWTEESIQGFWSGDSFFASDEGQMLSYHLAHVLTSKLAKGAKSFSEFANHADAADAGAQAAEQYLGVNLQQLASSFLGPGYWAPA